jgi:hypothetical protein
MTPPSHQAKEITEKNKKKMGNKNSFSINGF